MKRCAKYLVLKIFCATEANANCLVTYVQPHGRTKGFKEIAALFNNCIPINSKSSMHNEHLLGFKTYSVQIS